MPRYLCLHPAQYSTTVQVQPLTQLRGTRIVCRDVRPRYSTNVTGVRNRGLPTPARTVCRFIVFLSACLLMYLLLLAICHNARPIAYSNCCEWNYQLVTTLARLSYAARLVYPPATRTTCRRGITVVYRDSECYLRSFSLKVRGQNSQLEKSQSESGSAAQFKVDSDTVRDRQNYSL